MCGIGGFFSVDRTRSADVAAAMLKALAARGPDASRVQWFDEGGRPSQTPGPHALLHARLSIIDPRPEADQPMGTADGRHWISYNGEVYDWAKDAAPLAAAHPFRTHSDTEYVLRAAAADGPGNVPGRFVGMFAFAFLDLERREVTLVRDRFGKKPLLWWSDGRSLAFASTLRGLLPALPEAARRFDEDALDAYLAHRYVPAPMSILAGARRLPAGHLLRWSLDGGPVRIERWYEGTSEGLPAGADWLDVLDTAIHDRCVADRPVGLFLSGGIDSSVVACRLAALGKRFEAFTASFPGSRFDEAAEAADLARRLDLPHRAVEVPESIRDDFPAIVAALDEPFADPSAIPLWYLARETTKHVKVVLGGDGGDELFAGYKRYGAHLRSALRGDLRLPAKAVAAAMPTGGAKLLEELSLPWREAYALRFSGLAPSQRRFLMPSAVVAATRWKMPDRAAARSALEELIAIDRENYLPEYILRKGDLTTMAHGLELRAPFLDHRFVETVEAMPAAERFTKPAKRLLGRALPEDLATRLFAAKKRGFNPPLKGWLRSDLAERFDGLGARLSSATDGRIAAERIDALTALYRSGVDRLAETALQLLVLDESLTQIREACRS